MSNSHHLFIVYIIASLTSIITATDDSSECGRHRKPWHLLTEDEKMLYVSGFHELRNNGKLDIFIATHHLADTPLQFADVHYTAEFFPWHSYFLTEIETQIRNLGEEYKCFSLPYWDFTNDAGHDDANDMPIYNDVLGSDGNEDNDYCVEDELWNRGVYKTTFLCSDSEKSENLDCCLKRHNGEKGHIPDAETLVPTVYSYQRYRAWQDEVVLQHTYVHGYLSGHVNKTHIYGHNAAEDPIFILLHNFLMYLRALRMTCFGYDRVINELEEYEPFAYDPYLEDRAADTKPYLDLAMDFNVLAEQEWSRVYTEDITVRKIFDLKQFDISFELGTFWNNNIAELSAYCGDNLNETWFYNTIEYNDYNQYNKDIVVDRKWKSVFNHSYVVYIGVSVVFLLFVTIWGSFKYTLCDHRKSVFLSLSLSEDDHCNDYGTF